MVSIARKNVSAQDKLPLDKINIDDGWPTNIRIGKDAMPNAMRAPPSPSGSHLTAALRAVIWPDKSAVAREAAASVLGMGMNVVIGQDAMKYSLDNTHCIAIGHRALEGNTSIIESGHNYGVTGIGFRTFHQLRGARYSTACGIDCCHGVVNGDYITAYGAHIATRCQTVISSILLGSSTCYAAKEVHESIVIGDSAADGGTTQQQVAVKYGLFIGHRSARSVTGPHNQATGHGAFGNGALAGSYNHADGRAALMSLAANSTGNTAVGDGANTSLVAGHETTALGHNSSAEHDNSTAIGSGARTTSPNQVMLGGPTTTEVKTLGAFVLCKMARPTPPDANTAQLFIEDDGSGKCRLMLQFSSGEPIQLAIQH